MVLLKHAGGPGEFQLPPKYPHGQLCSLTHSIGEPHQQCVHLFRTEVPKTLVDPHPLIINQSFLLISKINKQVMRDLSKDFVLLTKMEIIASGWSSIMRLTFEAILKSVFQTNNFFVYVCDTSGWISGWFCHFAVLSTALSGK